MSDKLYSLPIDKLLKWILVEENKSESIFGIYKQLFFNPTNKNHFNIKRYNQILETPLGVAAGPHTQMAQNIVTAWLVGARYIELKTVQTLDELEISKPCIDLEDVGYNCEWSQELKIQNSFDEYLNAWILIHILKHKFGWNENSQGFIFNLSVGYNLEGIKRPNVQWFFEKMNDCSFELNEKLNIIEDIYPGVKDISIPSQISDNITLSTMHGCPPDEILSIGKYLLEEKKLHTTIKLNPTLLGPERVRFILNEKLGYSITVPDEAFEHDLKFEDAKNIITQLTHIAKERNLDFGLKLTNTLESINSTNWLPQREKFVYTSGRPLHPISINLAEKLQSEFNGELDISFSAGVDAFNVSDTLACNLKPITVCSDLLKPGGYLRMLQYHDEIERNIFLSQSKNIDEFILNISGKDSLSEAGLTNLRKYSIAVLDQQRYHKSAFPYDNIKTQRALTEYDCIHAPCIEECAVSQDVPEYMYYTAKGDFKRAYYEILKDNPLPNITGNVCDHLCQTKCTKMNYDNPLLIRAIKRFNAEQFDEKLKLVCKEPNGIKAAIIGAGPAGLSCAYFLALEGFEVDVYESKPFAGGMTSDSIPYFRLTDEQIEADINVLKSLGINFNFNSPVNASNFDDIKNTHKYIFLSVGAQKAKRLNIEGEHLTNVYDQLSFLSDVRRNKQVNLGKKIAIIGGGNSAVDAARTAKRIAGNDGQVAVIYRRTVKEMPADPEEVRALLSEGIYLIELTSPLSISNTDSILELKCIKNQLIENETGGRKRPIPIDGSEFSMGFDSIITAIGQDTYIDFLPDLKFNDDNLSTSYEDIFIGGDALRGADSLINAIGDGKNVANKIIEKENFPIEKRTQTKEKLSDVQFQYKQAYRQYGINLPEISLDKRDSFDLVHPTLTKDQAIAEAQRCLYCNDICNICVGVCPNLANVSFISDEYKIPIYEIDSESNSNVINYFEINQDHQILNIGDFCNECGNCNTFCPTNDAPYITKPKFYLNKESFENEDNCYLLKNNCITFKSNGRLYSLTDIDTYLEYEDDYVNIRFNKNNYEIISLKLKSNINKSFALDKAAELIYLGLTLANNPIFAN